MVEVPPVVEARRLSKTYLTGGSPVHALVEVSVSVHPGEYVAVMGPSGSGKSTFMNMVGLLDTPTSGELYLSGQPVADLEPDALALLRNARIGFVFQQFNLLARTTALANAALPLVYAGLGRAERLRRAEAALTRVGLGDRLDHSPTQLSGGQQQRVAIARALVTNPSLLLADEPTGALDSERSAELLELLAGLNREGLTIILVTHEPDVAERARRQLRFRDGRLVEDRTR